MTTTVLQFSHVYKKFSRGQYHDSLRDLVPAMVGRLLRRGLGQEELREREFWALRDISFDVERGESVAIVGHNGAGKSTILKHLSGIMQPTKGRIVTRGRLAALIEVGAGFHGDLTGRENIFLNGVILGMSRAEIRRKFDAIVEFSGLEEFLDTPVKRYSSGMYARLGFSVAVHIEPDVLIVDEVLSVGDLMFQTKSLAKMRSILRGGSTVVFVSHNLQAVSELCARTILLDKGRVLADGPTEPIIQQYIRHVQGDRVPAEDLPCKVDAVAIQDQRGTASGSFETGEHARIIVELSAKAAVSPVAVVIWLEDTRGYKIFGCSSELLGLPPMNLGPGERRVCQFDLTLHLAPETYRLNVALHRYDTNATIDAVQPAATFVVTSRVDVTGACNLYPEVRIDVP